MLPRSKPEDDDDIGLPALPPVGQDEEFATDLGPVAPHDFGEESVSNLDDSTASDLFDPVSFLQIEDRPSVLDDEGTGAIGEEALSLHRHDDDEYGYTEGNEPLKDLELGGDLVKDTHTTSTDDGGAEGLDGLFPIRIEGDDSLPGLAPIELDPNDDGKEELMDDLDLARAMDLRLDGPPDPARPLPPMAPAAVHWPLAEPTNAIAMGPDGQIIAGGLQLFVRSPEGAWTKLRAAGLEEAEVVSVAFQGKRLIVGTRLQGVFVSDDDGASFTTRNTWCDDRRPGVPSYVVVDGNRRLWLHSGGALHRSDTAIAGTLHEMDIWLGPLLPVPVVSLARDGDGVAALAVGEDASTLFVSGDGVRWARRSLDIPASSDAVLTMHDGRAYVALPLDSEGPYSESAGASVPGLVGASRLIAGSSSIFGVRHVAADDRVVVIREEEGAVHTLLNEASGQAAGPDGNHCIHDALMADGSLWLALGGGVAQVVPE